MLAGCYVYVPVDNPAAPPAGKRVAFELTDRGRVALFDRMGGGVLRLEGTVTGDDSDQYVMDVWRVAQLNGETTRWSGERVRINRDFVGGVLERKLSNARTYLLAGGATVAMVMLAKSVGLIGAPDATGPQEPDSGGPAQSRVWSGIR